MITVLALSALGLMQGHSDFQFGGLPKVENPSVRMESADVKIDLSEGKAHVTELVLFKNESANAVDAVVSVPRYRRGGASTDAPSFPVQVSWNKMPANLSTAPEDRSMTDLIASAQTGGVHMAAGETSSVRITFDTPFGTTGYGGAQSEVGFRMPDSAATGAPVGQVNVAFSYNQRVVLGLPTIKPDWKWQIGRNGAAVRLANFVPGGQFVSFKFYRGGF